MQVPKIGLIQASHLVVRDRIGYLALRHLLDQVFRRDRVGRYLVDKNATTQLLIEVVQTF